MMIISFAWTTEAFLQRRKTATRRFWDEKYTQRFIRSCEKNKGCFQAYDRSPRYGGHAIGVCRLTCQPYKQALSLFTDADEKAEGGLWGSAAAYVEMMGGPDKEPVVIEFEIVKLTPGPYAEQLTI